VPELGEDRAPDIVVLQRGREVGPQVALRRLDTLDLALRQEQLVARGLALVVVPALDVERPVRAAFRQVRHDLRVHVGGKNVPEIHVLKRRVFHVGAAHLGDEMVDDPVAPRG
jgi:hypothetical protein